MFCFLTWTTFFIQCFDWEVKHCSARKVANFLFCWLQSGLIWCLINTTWVSSANTLSAIQFILIAMNNYKHRRAVLLADYHSEVHRIELNPSRIESIRPIHPFRPIRPFLQKVCFSETIQNHSRTSKTCFTLGLECFGHLYSFESGTLWPLWWSPRPFGKSWP